MKEKINIMGFGGIPIMSGHESEFLVKLKNVEYEEMIKLIKEAYNMGVNFFDTAVDYGDSEEKLGIALKDVRENIYFASKSKALTYDNMLKDVNHSLIKLQTSYIDLYQFHYVKDENSYHTIMGENGSYKALEKLKKEGVIKNIGLATHNPYVAEIAFKTCKFDYIQIPYNIIENFSEKIIKQANEQNIKVLIMKPYAGGSLVEINDKTRAIVRNDKELKKLAIEFILKKNITSILIGVSSVEELFENYEIINSDVELTVEEEEKIELIKEVIGKEFCRRCQYCEPCPMGIQISKILRFRKYFDDYGLKKWAIEQYNELDTKIDSCINCYKCEEKCPYDLKIVDMLSETHSLLKGGK